MTAPQARTGARSDRSDARPGATEPPLGVAVVGCGYIAELHLGALAASGPLRVTGVCDLDPARAARLAAHTGAPVLAMEPLVQTDRTDLVLVCTPHDAHAEPVLAAAEAGHVVLCEKPLALTGDAAARLRDRLGDAAGRVVVGFNQRFMPGVARLRALLRASGDRVRAAHLDLVSPPFLDGWAGHPDRGGGVLVGLGSHAVDLVRFLLAEEIVAVRAAGSRLRLRPPALDDTATLAARTAGGVHASVTLHDGGSQAWSMDAANLLRVRVFTDGAVLDAGVTTVTVTGLDGRVSHTRSAAGAPFPSAWGYHDQDAGLRDLVGGVRDARLAGVDDGVACARVVDAALRDARRTWLPP